MRVGTPDSGSGMSSASVGAVASAPPRYPLTSVELNTPPHQQQSKHNNENQHPGHGKTVFLLSDNHGTPSRTRSRTASRSRSRTSSWAGKGVLVHPGLSSSRQAAEAHGGYPATVTNTPSKGSRVSGVYMTSNRPTLVSARNNGHVSHVQRRAAPLQRSHSSHGEAGSIDYILPQTWTGSGNAPKSARRWARTAHLHEVKGKRRVGESWYGGSNGEVGGAVNRAGGEGGGDVFGGIGSTLMQVEASQREGGVVTLLGEDADVDADGWESASDVGVESIEGM
ncbi:hypothetical protein P691DRAFT_102345 [Macrolepiota fuliginosa MF-IS2]|uniref:Uncharacterized protein n=1 Tax=Macrolepiota fuliginosa MF-IS2 TaxID=1400762 RepID=A0A9P5XQ37_9AGAR|nr:hypothetical protein P691DRAFT_102345 [Macrolepiota fuliginosa MF-IS2]